MLQKIPLKSVSIISVVGLILGGTVGFTAGSDVVDYSQVSQLFSDASQNQIAQAGFFFTLAAWIHSGRVKKEISSNFAALTLAINQVAEAFREDLKKHGDRLDNLASRVETLESKPKE